MSIMFKKVNVMIVDEVGLVYSKNAETQVFGSVPKVLKCC